MSLDTERPKARLQHRSKGRARARLEPGPHRDEQLRRAKRRLEAQPGIADVEVNARTGSVLVRGGREDQIDDALQQVFRLVSSVEKGEPSEEAVMVLVNAVREADGRVRSLTAGHVSLRWLVPGLFVGAGVRQLLTQGLTLGTIPWYVLLYYGVDSFMKLYPEHSPLAQWKAETIEDTMEEFEQGSG